MSTSFAPAFTQAEARALWTGYVSEIDRMVAMIGPDAAELANDLRMHLADSYASEHAGSEAERLQRAIQRLGRPEDFLRPLLADGLIELGTARYSAPLISRGLYHAIRSGSGRAGRAGLFAMGYLLLVIFAAMTVLKPFFGDHVGLIRGANGSLIFGMVSTGGGEDLLGLWSVPLTLALCALLYILLTRLLRRSLPPT